jgi:uncharacterized protein YcgI (DUF1989 family)
MSKLEVLQEIVIQPGTGKALEVRRGEVLRIEQIEGGQCADFNCFNLRNYREHLHVGRTRTLHGLHPGPGDFLWSAPPRERPMMSILKNTARDETDGLFPRCTAFLYEYRFGLVSHISCQEIQAEAQREYGLTLYDVHDSFNLFMVTGVDDSARPWLGPSEAKPGDHIDLLALMDVLAVTNVCADDLAPTNNFKLSPLRLTIRETTEEELARVTRRRETQRFAGQLDPQEFRVKTEPELVRDPEYVARFRGVPIEAVELKVDLSAADQELIERLRADGRLGEDPGEIIRAAFLRWWTERLQGQPDATGETRNRQNAGSGQPGER